MIVKRFLHLLVDRHYAIYWVFLLLFVFMNYLEFYLVEPFSVAYDVLVCLVEFIKFRCCIFDDDFFIGMDEFGFSSVRCAHIKVWAVFLDVENFIAIVELHFFWINCFNSITLDVLKCLMINKFWSFWKNLWFAILF